MASFVNLMGNDIWTETDIINRTEALIRSEFPDAAVAILNRKATGAALGQYTMTAEEQGELARYVQVCEEARQAGIAARADMALLQAALDVEAAQRRLASEDESERAAAQAVIDAAAPEALALVAARSAATVEAA